MTIYENFVETYFVFVRSIPPASVSTDVFAALSYIADEHNVPIERLILSTYAWLFSAIGLINDCGLEFVREPQLCAQYRTPEPTFGDEPRPDMHLFVPHDSAIAPYWSDPSVSGACCLIEQYGFLRLLSNHELTSCRTWSYKFTIAILPADMDPKPLVPTAVLGDMYYVDCRQRSPGPHESGWIYSSSPSWEPGHMHMLA